MLRALVFTLFLAAACATTRHYQEQVQAWVGRPSTELIAVWGAPNATSTLPDGSQIFVYTTIDEETRQKTARNLAGYPVSCRTTFRVRRGTVVGWSWQGENCRAK